MINPIMTRLFQILNACEFDSLDYQIAKTLCANHKKLQNCSGPQIAEQCQVSLPKLLKFLKSVQCSDIRSLKQEMAIFEEVKMLQLQDRYLCFSPELSAEKLLPISSARSAEELLQRRLLERVTSMIHDNQRIILIGSLDMICHFLPFQLNMMVINKLVLADPNYEQEWNENDLLCVCTLTGRLFSMNPEIYEKVLKHPQRFFLSSRSIANESVVQIPSQTETFESFALLEFYLDAILYLYERKYGDVSARSNDQNGAF